MPAATNVLAIPYAIGADAVRLWGETTSKTTSDRIEALLAATQMYSAPAGGQTVPAGGTLGYSNGLAVPAANFPRLVQIRLTGLTTALTPNFCDLTIRDGSSNELVSCRFTGANQSHSVIFTKRLSANVGETFNAVATASTPGGATFTNASRWANFQAIVWPCT